MADEAFALSPISARAAEPSDADYAAIREAFMETSRGRWFLNEYTKRNRNADTSMVLEAVARIEENLREQNQTLSEGGLTQALTSIRRSVDEARIAALQAIDGRAVIESVGPIRKGARVIREIAWRLREIGADGRICDLIASQVETIEAACAQIAAFDSNALLDRAFGLIEERIETFDGSEKSTVQTPKESPAPHSEPPPVETIVETAMVAESVIIVPEPVTVVAPQPVADAAAGEAMIVSDPIVISEGAEATMTPADIVQDEAVLERIALEMRAPDFESATSPLDAPTLAPVSTDISKAIEPEMLKPSALSLAATEPGRLTEASLGESLIANGIVRRPIPSISDPFAQIRRLSQAEKIAFFS